MPSIRSTAFVRGIRVACACVAKLPDCSWLSPYLDALRLRDVFCNNSPTRSHLTHLSIIARLVSDGQLRCVHRLAASKSGIHFRVANPRDQERSFDRIRRATFSKMSLDRVRQRLEQVAVVPWADIKTRRARARFAGEFAGEMPMDAAAGRRGEHHGAQAIAIVQQYTVRDKRRACVVLLRWT